MTEKLFPERLIDDLTHLLGSTVREVLPSGAQKHLLAAQRELFLALATTVEHHSARGKRKATPAQKKKAAAAKRPKRVPLD